MDRIYGLSRLNYWYSTTIAYPFTYADLIVLNCKTTFIETPYIFKRKPIFCYSDSIRDYVMRYVPDQAYLSLINRLRMNHRHLMIPRLTESFLYEDHAPSTKDGNTGLGNHGRGDFEEVAGSQ